MNHDERDLESEREELLKQLSLHVSPDLKARIDAVVSVAVSSPGFTLTISHSGAADAHAK